MELSDEAKAVMLEYGKRRDIAWQYLADSLVAPLRKFVVSNLNRFDRVSCTRLDTGGRIDAIRLPVFSPAGRQMYLDPDPDQLPLLEGSGRVVEVLIPLPRYELAQLMNSEHAFADMIARLDAYCREGRV